MPDIPDDNWSERDDRNAEVAPLGWPPGLPAQIELIGRMMMGAIRRFWNKINPAYATTGTGDNYIVTPEGDTIFLNLYEIIRVRVNRTNTTATPTLKFGRTNARTIVKVGTGGIVPLIAGDLLSGRDHSLWYNGTNFVLSDPATVDSSVTVGLLKTANNLSELTATAATARGNIGLGNVDNTSDVNKPVSTAQGVAIAAAQSAAISTSEAYADAGLALKLSLTGGLMSGVIQNASFSPSGAPTKIVAVNATAITAGQTRALAMPDRDVDLGKIGWELVGTVDLTGAASTAGAFTNLGATVYDQYRLEIMNAIPATTAVDMYLENSTNNGSSYGATSDVNWRRSQQTTASATITGINGASDTKIILGNNIANTANLAGFEGSITFFPSAAARNRAIFSLSGHTGANEFGGEGSGFFAAATNALRVRPSSGNWTSGRLNLYGIRH
jgi:hypothetical protein